VVGFALLPKGPYRPKRSVNRPGVGWWANGVLASSGIRLYSGLWLKGRECTSIYIKSLHEKYLES
jgi:hypothetical protein